MFVAKRKTDGQYKVNRYRHTPDFQSAKTFTRIGYSKNSAYPTSAYDFLEVHIVLGPDPSKPAQAIKAKREPVVTSLVDMSKYDLTNMREPDWEILPADTSF